MDWDSLLFVHSDQDDSTSIGGPDFLPFVVARIRGGDSSDPRVIHTGTGYIFNIETDVGLLPLLVSNRHVLADRAWLSLDLRIADVRGAPRFCRPRAIRLEKHETTVICHPNPDIDLSVVLAAEFLRRLEAQGEIPFWPRGQHDLMLDEEIIGRLHTAEQLIMVGFPNGIMDYTNNLPIIRKGILATPYAANFRGNPHFLIDMAVFGGSSGSPIFGIRETAWRSTSSPTGWQHYAELKLLGFLSAGFCVSPGSRFVARNVPTVERASEAPDQMLHLGICVKVRCLDEIVSFMKEKPEEALYGAHGTT